MRNDILIGIIITMLNEGKCTYKHLAEKFEVSKKTIQRYMTTLEMAGIPTISTYGRGGGNEIAGAFNLENIFFTKDEVARLFIHLKSSPLNSLDNLDKQIEEKISFKFEGVKSIKNNFIIDYTNWGYSKTLSPTIKLLLERIEQQKTYEIKYTSSNGSISTRVISPYKIIFKDFKWYLFAHCHTKNEARIFKLNRIQELCPSEEQFIPPLAEDGEILNHIDSVFNLIELELEANISILPDLEEWINISEAKPLPNGKIKIVGSTSKTSVLIDKILSYSPNLVLTKPQFLLDELTKKCENNYKLYCNK